jgi:hypothetical protein
MEQFGGSLFGSHKTAYTSKLKEQLGKDKLAGCSNVMPPPQFFPNNLKKEPKRKVVYVAHLYQEFCKYESV